MNKNWFYPAGLIVVLLVAFYVYSRYQVAPKIDFKILNLSDLEGKPFDMASLSGKKVVLSFGASWCGNCREELNDLKAIKDTELKDVEIVVISDESIEKIIGFKNAKAYPFTFIKMEQSFSSIGVNSIPTSYIINTKQEIKKETVGYINWKDPATLTHLKKLME